jgi:hypothetical protein
LSLIGTGIGIDLYLSWWRAFRGHRGVWPLSRTAWLEFWGAYSGLFCGNVISGRYSERFVVDAMVISGLTFNISGAAMSLVVSTSGNG